MSMETDIILEGFQTAEKQHSVRYMRSIGDGDSSVHPILVANVHEWGYDLQRRSAQTIQMLQNINRVTRQGQATMQRRSKLTEQMQKRLKSGM